MNPLGPILRGALLIAALAAQAFGQIAEISPPEGAAGTELHITGSGFGAGKPKVRLQSAAGKHFKLQVISWSDSAITAVIHHGVPGALTLRIKPKAAGAPTLTAPFTLHAPEPHSVYPSIAGPGERIILVGDFLGDAPLHVTVGGKKAAQSWPTALGPTFLLPQSLPFGEADLVVGNTFGSAALPSALTVADPGPPLGQDRVELHADGGTHVFTGETITAWSDLPVTREHLFTHASGNAPWGGMQLELWYEPHITPLPASFDVVPSAGTFVGGPLTVFEGAYTPNGSWQNASAWHITVDAASGGQIAGTFSGTCHHATLPDKVISGNYLVTLPPPAVFANPHGK